MYRKGDLAYYEGKLVECIENQHRGFVTVKNGGVVEKIPTDQLVAAIDHLCQSAYIFTPEGLAKFLERVGVDHGSEVALLLVDYCLSNNINLSACWDIVKFYVHDVLRTSVPDVDREAIYTKTRSIQEICNAVTLLARMLNDDDNENS